MKAVTTILVMLNLVTSAVCGSKLQARASSSNDISTARKPGGGDAMSQTCEIARRAIEARHFIGWRGLPPGCTPDTLFGMALDSQWGEMPLGNSFEQARSRLLEIGGYYRPLAYVRDGAVAMFDGTNPTLDGGWKALSDDLGTPEASLDWIHGTVGMPGGEKVYASRGITIFLNPENEFVVHVSVYVPTTVNEYNERLRLNREKRLLPMPMKTRPTRPR
jgi:hypothetical protein